MNYLADLLQDEMVVASVVAPTRREAMREIIRYAMQYSQDGPCVVRLKGTARAPKRNPDPTQRQSDE